MNWQEFYDKASFLLEEVPAGETRSLVAIATQVAEDFGLDLDVRGQNVACSVQLTDGKAVATNGLISFEAS